MFAFMAGTNGSILLDEVATKHHRFLSVCTIMILDEILHIVYNSSLKLGLSPPPGRLEAPEFILK